MGGGEEVQNISLSWRRYGYFSGTTHHNFVRLTLFSASTNPPHVMIDNQSHDQLIQRLVITLLWTAAGFALALVHNTCITYFFLLERLTSIDNRNCTPWICTNQYLLYSDLQQKPVTCFSKTAKSYQDQHHFLITFLPLKLFLYYLLWIKT